MQILVGLGLAVLVDPILWILAGFLGFKSKKADSSVGQWLTYSVMASVVYSIAVGAFMAGIRTGGVANSEFSLVVGFMRSLAFVLVAYLFYWKTKVPEKS